MSKAELIASLVKSMGQLSMSDVNEILLALESKLEDEDSDRDEELSEDEYENWYGLISAIGDAVLYTNALAEMWD